MKAGIMKRNIMVAAAIALAALASDIRAQAVPFDIPGSGAAAIKAVSPDLADPVPVPAEPSGAVREWLVLVFINGVNDLGILGFADKSVNEMEKAGSTGSVAVVAELGIIGADAYSRSLMFQRGSRTLFIRKDSDPGAITSPVIFSSDSSDMGSPEHLVRFAKLAVRRFPAEKVALIIWNHGGGRAGISWDDASGRHMEVDRLGAAMSLIRRELGRKVDVFATDACLMQTAEVAYELKDYAATIVGSEEVVPGDSYPYEAILAKLESNPGVSGEELGRIMVDAYGARYAGSGATLSALRASALPGFLNALNGWVRAVSNDPKAFKTAASADAVGEARHFEAADSRDLYDYLEKAGKRLAGSPSAFQAGAALENYIAGKLLIADTALPGASGAHGLAIYMPDLRYDSANYEKFSFAADSLWDDFLRLMMEERLKRP